MTSLVAFLRRRLCARAVSPLVAALLLPVGCGGTSTDAPAVGSDSSGNAVASGGDTTNASASTTAGAADTGASDGSTTDASSGSSDSGETSTGTGAGTCPGSMVQIDAPGGSFCMDAWEVSNQAFEAVLGDPMPPRLPGFCGEKTIGQFFFVQDGASDESPALTTFCQASAYCASQDKRLCGAVGGGAVPYGNTPEEEGAGYDASVSEWYFACTAGATQPFPYGTVYDAAQCEPDGLAPVQSELACEGGVAGLFGLVGGMVEWEDSCFKKSEGDRTEGRYACRARGDGASPGYTSSLATGCDFNSAILFDTYLSANMPAAAIRCCADVTPDGR